MFLHPSATDIPAGVEDISISKQANNLNGTFHRRVLKEPAISFSSTEGRKIFKEALELDHMYSYFPLSESFQTQAHPAFCGLGTLTMVLNAMLLDPKRVWKGI